VVAAAIQKTYPLNRFEPRPDISYPWHAFDVFVDAFFRSGKYPGKAGKSYPGHGGAFLSLFDRDGNVRFFDPAAKSGLERVEPLDIDPPRIVWYGSDLFLFHNAREHPPRVGDDHTISLADLYKHHRDLFAA
jgi:hypothetical protein